MEMSRIIPLEANSVCQIEEIKLLGIYQKTHIYTDGDPGTDRDSIFWLSYVYLPFTLQSKDQILFYGDGNSQFSGSPCSSYREQKYPFYTYIYRLS